MNQAPELSDAEFDAIRQLVKERIGINLTEQKRALVVGRLQGALRAKGLPSYAAYLDLLRQDSGGELTEFANRISTNFSYFWREPEHFEVFRSRVITDAMAEQAALPRKDLRVWVAGCSTGEEPYCLAMVAREALGGQLASWDANILATDISARALGEARQAVYSSDRVERLPANLKQRYLRQRDDGQWQVASEVTGMVVLRSFNLMNRRFPFRGLFHAIFCRNVMIYFDRETREALVDRYVAHLRPGGWLFIGHSESIGRDRPDLDFVRPATFRKKGG